MEPGKEGGERAGGRRQRARGAAGASTARPSRLLLLLLLLRVRSARVGGGMGWPGGSPCCCPAPPRPRPAGRPPQVSGRAARGGRAAACASRSSGQCRGRSPGGAGPPGGKRARGRGSRDRGGQEAGGREGDQRVGPARGHFPAGSSRLRASGARTPGPGPATHARATRAGLGPGANRLGRVLVRVFLFHVTSGETEADATSKPLLLGPFRFHCQFSRSPWAHSHTRLPSLSPSLGLTPPPRLGCQPLIQPQLFPGRGSVGGGVSPNKPKASE